MTDNNKNKEKINELKRKRQRIVKKIDGVNYIKVGEGRFVDGKPEYFEDPNYRALKLEYTKERPEKHYIGKNAKNLSGELLKLTANNIEKETNKISLVKLKTQERA